MDDIAIIWDLNGVIYKDYKLDPQTLKIVIKLNTLGYNQYVFTNIRLSKLEECLPEIKPHFKKIFATKEFGHLKPDPKSFRHVKSNLVEKTLCFIDNSLENVEISKMEGFKGILYTCDIDMIENLKCLGINYD